MTGASARLFDDAFLRTLAAVRLVPRRALAGLASGERRSPAFGSSVEFADYRTYAPGDDYRRIDWNAYARLERLFLRRFRADENLALSILVDASASMAWGEPSKAQCAAQVAGALSFVGLRAEDTVTLAACRDGTVAERRERLSGDRAVLAAWRFLEQLAFTGETDLDASLARYARQVRGHGLDALLAAGQEVVLIQVLAPDELRPPADLLGDWHLVDAEHGAGVEVSIDERMVRAYRDRVDAYLAEIEAFCRRRGVSRILLSCDADLRQVLVPSLRRAGVLV